MESLLISFFTVGIYAVVGLCLFGVSLLISRLLSDGKPEKAEDLRYGLIVMVLFWPIGIFIVLWTLIKYFRSK